MTNRARGEVPVRVGDQDLTICITPETLCHYSAAIGAKGFVECIDRAQAAEPNAIFAAVQCFGSGGDIKQAITSIELRQYVSIGAAVLEAFTAHVGDDKPGKTEGGDPTT